MTTTQRLLGKWMPKAELSACADAKPNVAMPVATVPTDILEPSARNSGRNRGKSPIIRRIVPTKRIQPNMRHRVSRGLFIEAEKDLTRKS